jgi:hypothetical protein
MFSDPVQGDKLAASFDALASISSHDSPPEEQAPM